MQTLIQMIIRLVAAIAAAALAQFGVDVNTPEAEREVRRMADCTEQVAELTAPPPSHNC
ncbi:hypothetical protein IWC96_04700 [Brevundimonas sp. BAL450]|jgi:hypothetical protein|uniref:Uncharacterized protein n=1 Tax=Brevundimonas abyssalis TAR-001 TaxID=1391729 RepID=A0A8E0NCC1_9CAUL|nr:MULTISPECIES: hypothetical protein [Brevundimonas]MBG7614582.1 hypothetical protein [Brevundimonas sp. BAL450]GAD59706.1 hypothetical protein MBEBAB_1956 [Brevundimonas abyssalis TAR-001]